MQGESNPQHGDHWLYRCFNADGDLLYVGITSEGFKRFRVHGNRKEWWPEVDTIKVQHFETQADCRAEEKRLIRALQPPYNARDLGPQGDPTLIQIYQRCRSCHRTYRPADDTKHKATCPRCVARFARIRARRDTNETQGGTK